MSRLQGLSDLDDDYWSFEGKGERDYTHDLFQYPAMMVPRMQREILHELLASTRASGAVFDPFVGSGTVMTEAMLRGRDFIGVDINPLAILLCRAKSEYFDADFMDRRLRRILTRASGDLSRGEGPSFPGKRKWFNGRARVELARLQRAIERDADPTARRFAWVVLAETIRLCSNSRTSTVKLHIRPTDELDARSQVSPIQLFRVIAARNVESLREQQRLLEERQHVVDGEYEGIIQLHVGDVATSDQICKGSASILMTSPPYGDNQTTVTYGQHSYLPLRWIELADIGEDVTDDVLASTHELDRVSLGGSLKRALERGAELRSRSPSLDRILKTLERHPTESSRSALDGAKRVAAFYADLDSALTRILDVVHAGGYLVFTVGDRRVNGYKVPMANILLDLIGERAATLTTIERRIPPKKKRMATRNNVAATMDRESLIVMRKRANRPTSDAR